MGIRQWITKNAAKTAEVVVEQTKDNLQKTMQANVVHKGDVMFTIGKLALLGVLMWLSGKEISEYSKRGPDQAHIANPVPTTININNYIRENERSATS